jgi:hypothetical protein
MAYPLAVSGSAGVYETYAYEAIPGAREVAFDVVTRRYDIGPTVRGDGRWQPAPWTFRVHIDEGSMPQSITAMYAFVRVCENATNVVANEGYRVVTGLTEWSMTPIGTGVNVRVSFAPASPTINVP